MNPIKGVKPDKPGERPSVAVGDSIYYKHPETQAAHHGTVAAIGKDGVILDADGGGEHRVLWDGYLGHRRRTDRKLTIVDRGEDGSIMEDEGGKRVYVRGALEDFEHPLEKSAPSEPSLLTKARVVRELASAGFEPMMDYVRDTFGDNFVYRQQFEGPLVKGGAEQGGDVISSIERLRSEMNTNFQGLCAVISMLAESIERMAHAGKSDV